ncbi:putative meiotic phospholipase Spo1p [[Candida] railenensis]|uniref:Lysophospholipase n=1 Tax=[Candida] railenensis TaxID=45579 RepID=A0A9P0QLN6_9ASCO|nr:putative meiotic phospholipase Spo1p [[Candida] railenensis]
MAQRKIVSRRYLIEYLSRNSIPGFNHSELVKNATDISIAIAFSGGGYRSMLTGAGVLTAFDLRTPGSMLPNHLGGILQASNYITGISGGSWLVMSNMANDFKPNYISLQEGQWNINEKLLEGIPNFDLKNLESDMAPTASFTHSSSASQETSAMKAKESASIAGRIKRRGFLKNLMKVFNFSPKDGIIVSSTDPLEKVLKPIVQKERRNVSHSEVSSSLISWKKVISYYKDIHVEVRAKKKSGFPISLTDYWGRALSRRIFPRAVRSPGVTLSSVTKLESFRRFLQPFPIICTIEAVPEYSFNSETSHTFEINPFEFGSWDQYLNSFVDIKYLGTKLLNGAPTSLDVCMSGLDNLGFLTGASSSLFNYIFVYLYQNLLETKQNTKSTLQNILQTFGLRPNPKSWQHPQNHPDYALISPNPFLREKLRGTQEISKRDFIYLTDGGGDGQNIPFHPLLQYSRKVDIIFAFDMSGDILNFPNGTSLVRTSQRYRSIWNKTPYFDTMKYSKSNATRGRYRGVFPKVPSCEEFNSRGYTKVPVFFGCDLVKDYPTAGSFHTMNHLDFPPDYTPPLIIYFANTNHSFASNTSTFQMSYQDDEIRGMMQNGYDIATYINGTIDDKFSACLSCAILKREFGRQNIVPPRFCTECFEKYCYQG